MNFHVKSGVCSSKNERVIALGMKEDGHTLLSISSYLYSSDYTVQTCQFEVRKFGQKLVSSKFACLDNAKLFIQKYVPYS